MAKRAGYDSVPWFQLTWWVLWVYTLLTVLVMFFRPDFINMTVCTVALYMMFNAEQISKTKFKLLVFGIIISLIYDLFWFFMAHSEYANEQKNDGSGESGIRKFSLIMSYISFIARVSSYQITIQLTINFKTQSSFAISLF